jgi:hypothetical protein
VPPLLCLSPILLDQSFPRTKEELKLVGKALGNLQEYLMEFQPESQPILVLTDTLRNFLEEIYWNRPEKDEMALLLDVDRILKQLFFARDSNPLDVTDTISNVAIYQPHPLPSGCDNQGLIDFWADEIGKLLVKHDECCERDRFFVGVTCPFAFTDDKPGTYANFNHLRTFPLVGVKEIKEELDDCFIWDVPEDYDKRLVNFNQAVKNISSIGGRLHRKSDGDSHYHFKFENGATWTLSRNDDPVPKPYLEELKPKTDYPLLVIKYALINGELPQKSLRFEKA